MPGDEWVKILHSVHLIEHYVVPASYATWMGLEDIMLSEARRTEGKLSDVTYTWGIKNKIEKSGGYQGDSTVDPTSVQQKEENHGAKAKKKKMLAFKNNS